MTLRLSISVNCLWNEHKKLPHASWFFLLQPSKIVTWFRILMYKKYTAVMPRRAASGFVQTVVRGLLILAIRWQLFQSHISLTCIIMQIWLRLCASEMLHGSLFLWRHDISATRGSLYHGSNSILWLMTFDIERISKRNVHRISCRQNVELRAAVSFGNCTQPDIHFEMVFQFHKGRLYNRGGPGAVKVWSSLPVITNLCYGNSCIRSYFLV